MSHFAVLVLSDDGSEKAIKALLAPYDEDGEWFGDGSRWDWWHIGGRFTGLFDLYDATKDPANSETCNLCNGTGVRPNGKEQFGEAWFKQTNGCNGCSGTGISVKWPTQWAAHSGDTMLAGVLPEPGSWRFFPSAIVTPDGEWHERARMGWFGATLPDEDGKEEKAEDIWQSEVRNLIQQHLEAYATVVDCHV